MSNKRPDRFAAPCRIAAFRSSGGMILLCYSVAFTLFQTAGVRAAGRCVSPVTPSDAYRDAAAVFLGEAVEVKQKSVSTRAGSNFPYQETTLRVLKSWKLIDRQEVTVATAPAHYEKGCFTFSPGERYVVYAVWTGDTLYASLRTAKVEDAAPDLEMLGEGTSTLKPGEFRDHTVFAYGLAVCAALLLLLGGYAYRLSKKPLRAG
jgi:hypothetical protein